MLGGKAAAASQAEEAQAVDPEPSVPLSLIVVTQTGNHYSLLRFPYNPQSLTNSVRTIVPLSLKDRPLAINFFGKLLPNVETDDSVLLVADATAASFTINVHNGHVEELCPGLETPQWLSLTDSMAVVAFPSLPRTTMDSDLLLFDPVAKTWVPLEDLLAPTCVEAAQIISFQYLYSGFIALFLSNVTPSSNNTSTKGKRKVKAVKAVKEDVNQPVELVILNSKFNQMIAKMPLDIHGLASTCWINGLLVLSDFKGSIFKVSMELPVENSLLTALLLPMCQSEDRDLACLRLDCPSSLKHFEESITESVRVFGEASSKDEYSAEFLATCPSFRHQFIHNLLKDHKKDAKQKKLDSLLSDNLVLSQEFRQQINRQSDSVDALSPLNDVKSQSDALLPLLLSLGAPSKLIKSVLSSVPDIDECDLMHILNFYCECEQKQTVVVVDDLLYFLCKCPSLIVDEKEWKLLLSRNSNPSLFSFLVDILLVHMDFFTLDVWSTWVSWLLDAFYLQILILDKKSDKGSTQYLEVLLKLHQAVLDQKLLAEKSLLDECLVQLKNVWSLSSRKPNKSSPLGTTSLYAIETFSLFAN